VIGLDTNIIIRFLMQDDAVQSRLATQFISRLSRDEPGFVGAIVLAEISWVLRRAYKLTRAEISEAIEGLLQSAELVVENAHAAYNALALYRASTSVEFADVLIERTALLAGAAETVTFDKRAATEAGMRLLT
jgi:predicted nucleic-acid-binding protein